MLESVSKKIGKTTLALVALTLVAAALSGCIGGEGKTTIRIEGSTTVYPIALQCAEEFNEKYDDIEVQVATATGSGTGIKALGQGQCEIADASREVKQSEGDEYSDVDFYDNVVAYDGIAIIVSKEIYDAGVTALTSEQVIEIYTGEITNWKDVGGPDKTIAVHEREEGSGTRDTFMELLDIDETSTTASWQSNSLVQNAVATTDNAIGYVGLGYVSTDTPAVKLDGYDANEANVKAGTYPISRSLHMYTDGQPTGDIKKFIDFVLSDDGQDIVEAKNFIRLD